MTVKVCAFDAYGTLLDTAAAVRQTVAEPDYQHAAPLEEAIASAWRSRQLQYTWLRSLAGQFGSFWQITREALEWTLERHGLANDEAMREKMLDCYWNIEAFPEATATLQRVRGMGLDMAVLSNGSKMMLDDALTRCGFSSLLDAVLSVDDVKVFKPAPEVYAMVVERFGCEAGEVAFVSANGWDAAAAAAYGFRSIWINRTGEPMERLPGEIEAVLESLEEVPDRIMGMTE